VRAVLDTNVLVSAFISKEPSPPAVLGRLLREGRFELVTSQALLAELEGVLTRPKLEQRLRATGAFPPDVAGLSELADVVQSARPIVGVLRDADDHAVLEAAVAASVDYIVSGDAELLELGEFEGIRVLTPARFLVLLQG
jgi:putative PIN family toxin of toxin-antitoxin system